MARDCFLDAVGQMVTRTGTQCFLTACTDIPLVLNSADLPAAIKLYDPSQLTARELAQLAFDK
jgi:aspartate/glutamate racemase